MNKTKVGEKDYYELNKEKIDKLVAAGFTMVEIKALLEIFMQNNP